MALDFPNSPSVGSLFTSGAQTWKWDGTKWAVASSGGLKGDGVNILRRNGGFEIWQRGAGGSASFAVASGPLNVYTADGWCLGNNAGQASVVSQVPGIVNGSQWAAKVQRNAGQTGVAFETFSFPLDTDELFPLLGQFVTLSFTAKAGANWSPASGILGVQLFVGTGTPTKWRLGFTNNTTVVAVNASLTPTATRFQDTSGIFVPVNTQQAELVISWTPVGTAGVDDSFTIDDVQLEIVPSAAKYAPSNFERLNFEEQLLLCMRHYQKTFHYNVAPAHAVGYGAAGEFLFSQCVAAAAGQYGNYYPFVVPMRANPTGTPYNPGAGTAGQIWNGIDNTSWSSTGMSASQKAIQVYGVSPAGSVVGRPSAFHMSLDAGI